MSSGGLVVRTERPVADDAEAGVLVVLPEQGDPIDRKMIEMELREAAAEHRQDRLAPRGAEPARQGHMEAKLVADVRIAPAVEIVALARCQGIRIAPRAVVLGQ